MKDFMIKRPMLAFLVISVVATLISAWLLNPTIGPAGLFSGAGGTALALKIIGALLIVAAGAALTYVAMRVGNRGRGLGPRTRRCGIHSRPPAGHAVRDLPREKRRSCA